MVDWIRLVLAPYLPSASVIFDIHGVPCDAMNKRGLCCHAVSVSVCLSVTFVDSVKRSNHILILFHHRVATPL